MRNKRKYIAGTKVVFKAWNNLNHWELLNLNFQKTIKRVLKKFNGYSYWSRKMKGVVSNCFRLSMIFTLK